MKSNIGDIYAKNAAIITLLTKPWQFFSSTDIRISIPNRLMSSVRRLQLRSMVDTIRIMGIILRRHHRTLHMGYLNLMLILVGTVLIMLVHLLQQILRT